MTGWKNQAWMKMYLSYEKLGDVPLSNASFRGSMSDKL